MYTFYIPFTGMQIRQLQYYYCNINITHSRVDLNSPAGRNFDNKGRQNINFMKGSVHADV